MNAERMNMQEVIDCAARDALGVYPRAVTKNGITQLRTEWQDGWNSFMLPKPGEQEISKDFSDGLEACKRAYDQSQEVIAAWFADIQEDTRNAIAEMIDGGTLFLSLSGELRSHVELSVNCNDLFYWACADTEPITLEEIPSLIEERTKNSREGATYWACKKRGMRPQWPVERDMRKDGTWTEEMEALPPRSKESGG